MNTSFSIQSIKPTCWNKIWRENADKSDVLCRNASTSLSMRRRRVYLAIKCGKWAWQLPSTLALSAFSYLAWIYFIKWTICLNAVYHAEIEIRLLHGEFSQELLTFLTEKTYWKFDLDRIDILTWKFCPENVFLSENQRPVMALDQFVNAVQTLSSQVAR